MEKTKEKINIMTYAFAFSFWMILFTWEGGLSVQTLLPFIMLSVIAFFLCKGRVIKLDNNMRSLGLWVIIVVISTVINSIIHIDVFTSYNVTGCIYFFVIFVWFVLTTKDKKNNREIQFIFNNMIIVGMILSIKTIILSVTGYSGKIMISNLVGTLLDENLVTAYISTVVVIAFIRIMYMKKLSKLCKILNLVSFIVNFVAICLTGSRASLISCVFAIIICVILSLKKMNILKISIIIISIIVLGYFAINLMPDWIYTRYFTSDYMDNSNTARLKVWNNALKGISDQPLLGFGMGTFSSMKSEYPYTAGYSTPGHETYLDILLYSGIIGFLVFGLFLYNILIKFIVDKRKRIFLPLIIDVFLISLILSATKTIFFWSTIIILRMVDDYMTENTDEQF